MEKIVLVVGGGHAENTFIGANATMLREVKIRGGSVIGASSIVRKDINQMVRSVGNNRILWKYKNAVIYMYGGKYRCA